MTDPKLNKQTIQTLANSIDRNRAIGGVGEFSTQTPNGTIFSRQLDLKSLQNGLNPQLWSVKTAPAQKYIHLDQNDTEYPGLYVYLGPNVAYSMEAVGLKNPWIADGSHPKLFAYGNFKTASAIDIVTYHRTSAGTKGDRFDASWNTKDGIEDCFTSLETGFVGKSNDGWFELPVAAIEAMPLYGMAFAGPGMTNTLGFFSTDRKLFYGTVENPDGLSGTNQYTWLPNFDRFQTALSAWDDCYHGLVGSPKLLYDLNPYSDSIETSAWNNSPLNLYTGGNIMEFIDQTDTLGYSFRPILRGLAPSADGDNNEKWQYGFFLEMQPQGWDSGSGVSADTVYTKSYFIDEFEVDVGSATEGKVYACKYVSQGGYERYFNILQLPDNFEPETAIQRLEKACKVKYSPSACDLVTNKGDELGIIIDIDYEQLAQVYNQPLKYYQPLGLSFVPVDLPDTEANCVNGVNGMLCYIPVATKSHVNLIDTTKIGISPPRSLIRACTILGGARPVSYKNNGTGPWLIDVGEDRTRNFGKLCPRYINVSLEHITTPLPGDSFIDMTYEQGDGGSAWQTCGKALGQYGSIDCNSRPIYEASANNHAFYSLYQFGTASASKLWQYYGSGGSAYTDYPGEGWRSATGTSAYTTCEIVARIGNTSAYGETYNHQLGKSPDGYHLEYVDVNSLIPSGSYWQQGGTDVTNFGRSFKLGEGTNWVTVSVEAV